MDGQAVIPSYLEWRRHNRTNEAFSSLTLVLDDLDCISISVPEVRAFKLLDDGPDINYLVSFSSPLKGVQSEMFKCVPVVFIGVSACMYSLYKALLDGF